MRSIILFFLFFSLYTTIFSQTKKDIKIDTVLINYYDSLRGWVDAEKELLKEINRSWRVNKEKYVSAFFAYVVYNGSGTYGGNRTRTSYFGGYDYPFEGMKFSDMYSRELRLFPEFSQKKEYHYLYNILVDCYIKNNQGGFPLTGYVFSEIVLEIKDWINKGKRLSTIQANTLIKVYNFLKTNISDGNEDGDLGDMCLDLLRFSESKKVKIFLQGKRFQSDYFLHKNVVQQKTKDKGYTSYRKLIR